LLTDLVADKRSSNFFCLTFQSGALTNGYRVKQPNGGENEMAQLTFLDIFAGIGGMRRGLESAGHRCVGYIEWDKWARRSYEAIFNSESQGEWSATDVTTVRASELPTADIWGFGFPCQDLSVAGKQLGFNGNRSSLFFTVVGLLRELPEDRRPEWLIAENVMGFLSSNRGWDFLAAQAALDEIGYDTEWEVFNATQFGIPQNRQRVFLVGHSRRAGRREVFPIRSDDTKTAPNVTREERQLMWTDDGLGHKFQVKYDITPPLRAQGGGRTPGIFVSYNRKDGIGDELDTALTLNASDWQGLNRNQTQNAVAVVRNRGEWSERETAQCLDANYWKGIDNHGARTAIATETRIRKLTPLECWRLMGRSDDEFYAAKNAGVSDTQLYKQAGNSLIPQIVQAIGERIAVLSESSVEAVALT
jgi:DNA (cytosine-5)-methyltransferase 1